MILGIAAAVLGMFFIYVLTPQTIWIFPYTKIGAVIIAFGFIGILGIYRIPVGSVGVPLVFGKRTHFVLDEGYQWLGPIPFIVSYKEVSSREQGRALDPMDVFTKDQVRVRVPDAAVVWQIKNPDMFLSLERSVIETGLDDVLDEIIRLEIAGKTLDEVLGIGSEVRDKILSEASARSSEWGIKIVRVPVPSFEPDDDVVKDLALRRREVSQREGQKVQLEFGLEYILKIKEKIDCSIDAAREYFQIITQKITKTVDEKKFSLDDQTAEAIEKAIGLIGSILERRTQ